jgi:ABC-type tungstate transport system permease subunit
MRKRRLKVPVAIAVALVATGVTAAESQALTIRIFGTSDLFDSGVYQNRMQTLYNPTSPFYVAGDTLSYTSVGSGKALTSAENGFADVVLVHSPPLEAGFTQGGYSFEPLGRALLYNDYVIAGPTSDPAHVKTQDPHDGVKALQDVAAWGTTHSAATFVSRNDASGTNVQEETMWGQTTGVTLQAAQNRGTVTGLFQPAVSAGSTTFPGWYKVQTATSEQTQAANLISTSTCASAFAPDGGCYTMTDRGTLLYIQSQGQATGLTIVAENSEGVTTVVGGVTELINPFHAYIVTPTNPKPGSGGVYASGVTPNVTAATRFVNFLTGGPTNTGPNITPGSTDPPVFQQSLTSYLATDNGGNQVFFPDAFPDVKPGSAQPTVSGSPHTVAHSSTQTVAGTLVYGPPNQPPLSAPINGIPVNVYSSTNGGSTWTLAHSTTTGANGQFTTSVTMPATVGTTVILDVTTPTYNDTHNNYSTQFSVFENKTDYGSFKTS